MRPRFVLFGDSITQQSFSPAGGWGSALADHYSRNVDVLLRGYSGYNTRWALFLLDKIFPHVQSQAPLVVTVFFGANDAVLPDRGHKRQHVPVPEYKENLRKIISHIKGICETTHVVLITPPPIDEESLQETAWRKYGAAREELPSRENKTTGEYAKACIDIAMEAGVPVIDLWSSMQEKAGWQKTYLSDGLHLSPDGNAFVYEELLKVLIKVLASEAMECDFPVHSDVNADDPGKSFC